MGAGEGEVVVVVVMRSLAGLSMGLQHPEMQVALHSKIVGFSVMFPRQFWNEWLD